MSEVLKKKIQNVQKIEKNIKYVVDLNKEIDISSSSSSKRCSFPYSVTPYQEFIKKEALEKEISKSLKDEEFNFNNEINCSGSSEGVCIITRTLEISNSHAGSHADQPLHFLSNPPFKFFDNFQYNGPCTILDLRDKKQREITIDDIKNGIKDLENLTRLLIWTYKKVPDEWDDQFSFLSIETAEFLGKLPNLLLIGIDTPSVDHPSASPICNCSHGNLFKGCIAILENLDFSNIKNASKGILRTKWTNEFNDSKQCICSFFNNEE